MDNSIQTWNNSFFPGFGNRFEILTLLLDPGKVNMKSAKEIILQELEKITGTDQVHRDLDLPLFDEDLLDSLGTMELIVDLSEQLGISISPAEIDRQQWATPRKIIAYIEDKVKVWEKNIPTFYQLY